MEFFLGHEKGLVELCSREWRSRHPRRFPCEFAPALVPDSIHRCRIVAENCSPMEDCRTSPAGGSSTGAQQSKSLGTGERIRVGLRGIPAEKGSWGSVPAFTSDPTKYFIHSVRPYPPFSSTASTIYPEGYSSSKESTVPVNPRSSACSTNGWKREATGWCSASGIPLRW